MNSKDKTITIRVTEEEKEIIRKEADRMNTTISKYIINKVFQSNADINKAHLLVCTAPVSIERLYSVIKNENYGDIPEIRKELDNIWQSLK